MTTNTLLPCPFCGREPVIYSIDVSTTVFYAHCHGCAIRTAQYMHKPTMIAAWNRRTQPSVNPDLLGALEAMQALLDGIFSSNDIGKLRFQNYQRLNEAPMKARAAIAKVLGDEK